MKASGYTLDLYCDYPKCAATYTQETGQHGHGEYTSDERNCRRICFSEARKDGWKIGRRNGKDLCPRCNPRSRKYDKGKRS